MRLNVYKIDGYNFQADLDVEHRTAILEALGLPISYPDVLQVEGSFTVEWDDDIAMPQATLAHILHPTDPNIFVNYELFGSLEELDTQLEEVADYSDHGNWAADRQASLIDAACDAMEDR